MPDGCIFTNIDAMADAFEVCAPGSRPVAAGQRKGEPHHRVGDAANWVAAIGSAAGLGV
jgi:hypothetical protein